MSNLSWLQRVPTRGAVSFTSLRTGQWPKHPRPVKEERPEKPPAFMADGDNPDGQSWMQKFRADPTSADPATYDPAAGDLASQDPSVAPWWLSPALTQGMEDTPQKWQDPLVPDDQILPPLPEGMASQTGQRGEWDNANKPMPENTGSGNWMDLPRKQASASPDSAALASDVPNGQSQPGDSPADIHGTPNMPTMAPIPGAAERAADLRDQLRQYPENKAPSWWQRVAGIAAGAGAGISNAGGKTRRPIDIGAMEQAIQNPGYAQKVEQWNSQYAPMAAQVNMDVAQRQAQLAATKEAREAANEQSMAQYRKDSAEAMKQRADTEAANVKWQPAPQSIADVLGVPPGTPIPPSVFNSYMQGQIGRWAAKEPKQWTPQEQAAARSLGLDPNNVPSWDIQAAAKFFDMTSKKTATGKPDYAGIAAGVIPPGGVAPTPEEQARAKAALLLQHPPKVPKSPDDTARQLKVLGMSIELDRHMDTEMEQAQRDYQSAMNGQAGNKEAQAQALSALASRQDSIRANHDAGIRALQGTGHTVTTPVSAPLNPGASGLLNAQPGRGGLFASPAPTAPVGIATPPPITPKPQAPVATPQVAAPANPYIQGRVYGGLKYLGGDPKVQTSWQKVR